MKQMAIRNIIVDLEIVSHCNSTCVMCPRQFARPEGVMSQEIFDLVADELIRNSTQIVNFCGYGEPLIHRKLPQFVAFLASHGIATVLRTNGSLLSEKRVEALLHAGIQTINISAQAITKHTYENIMKGLSFDTLLRHLNGLLKLRVPGTVKVVINAVEQEGNRREVPLMRDFWKGFGVDHFELNACHSRGGELVSLEVYPKAVPPQWQGRCPIFPSVTYVTWDGDVLACCQDAVGGTTKMGNLRYVSLDAILKAKANRYSDGSMFELCRQCDKRVNYDWLLQ